MNIIALFFDRHAKFHHYRATHLIITGIEMDHVDLFSGIDEIIEEFRTLIAALPATRFVGGFLPIVRFLRAYCRRPHVRF